MQTRKEKGEQNEVGTIRIADEVVGIIAGMAATEIPTWLRHFQQFFAYCCQTESHRLFCSLASPL